MKYLILCLIITTFTIGCDGFSLPVKEKKEKQLKVSNLKTIQELDRALDQGKYDFVLKHAGEYLDEYPESDQGWLVTGWAYAKSGNLEKAKESFERVLVINKTNDNAYVGLGSVFRKSGENDKARESYKKAIRITPKNPEALSSLLVIELLDGQYDQAVIIGEKAWKIRKNLGTIPANLSVAYHYKKDMVKRDYFYQKAKELKYSRMQGLDDIFEGKVTIGNPPQ